MKRIIPLMILITVVFMASGMMSPQRAQAQLLPTSCTDWADTGYTKVVLGWLCAAQVAIEAAYPWQDRYSDAVEIKEPDDAAKREVLYALKTSPPAKNRTNWQVLRA